MKVPGVVALVWLRRDLSCGDNAALAARLARRHIAFRARKDHVIFEFDEIRMLYGGWFSVFTP